MTKKIFIVAILFFLIAVGVTVYLLFFHQSATQSPNSQQGFTNGYQPFPITSTNNNQAPSGTTGSSTNTLGQTAAVAIQTLTQLYASPIASAGVTSNKSGESVRLTDRATGHMYAISLASSTLAVVSELSDKTIPQIYRSPWVNGSTTILRYLDSNGTTIKTYSATLKNPKISNSTSTIPLFLDIAGAFLPDNIEEIASNPAGNQIFYLVQSATDVTGKIARPDNTKSSTIFTSAVSDWAVQWPAAATIALTTKASSVAQGYLYFLSTNGTIRRILGDIPGLVTVVDPTLNFVAYSDNSPTLSIYNIKSGTTQNTNLNTIANKCAWSPDQKGVLYCAVPNNLPGGQYPDSWYQGAVSFSDSIDLVDANTGQALRVADISQLAGQPIDAENLIVSPNDDYLIFTNKIDLSLWALRLQSAQ